MRPTSLVLVTALALGAACSSGARPDDPAANSTTMTSTQTANQPAAKAAKVYLTTPSGERAVEVEVVATPPKIERGLMYRQHMDADAGMLFLMGHEQVWTFWMHNTLIPLDMIFITKELTVAGVVDRAEPQTDILRKVNAPSTYVLEVNGGYCASHGVIAGARVRFENVPGL